MGKGWDKNQFKKYDPKKNGFGNPEKWKQNFQNRILNLSERLESDKGLLGGCNDLATLKKEYKKLVKQYHPDVAGDTPENHEAMVQLNKKYQELLKKFENS